MPPLPATLFPLVALQEGSLECYLVECGVAPEDVDRVVTQVGAAAAFRGLLLLPAASASAAMLLGPCCILPQAAAGLPLPASLAGPVLPRPSCCCLRSTGFHFVWHRPLPLCTAGCGMAGYAGRALAHRPAAAVSGGKECAAGGGASRDRLQSACW